MQDLEGLMCLIQCEGSKIKSVRAYQFLLDRGKFGNWRGLGADVVQTYFGDHIWNRHCSPFFFRNLESQTWREKEKYYLIVTRVIVKMKQKPAAVVLAQCPPCWCVGSILNISLQVVEWEQKPETYWLNLAAKWIALTKTFASLPVPFFLSAQAAACLITEGSLLENSISQREPCVG